MLSGSILAEYHLDTLQPLQEQVPTSLPGVHATGESSLLTSWLHPPLISLLSHSPHLMPHSSNCPPLSSPHTPLIQLPSPHLTLHSSNCPLLTSCPTHPIALSSPHAPLIQLPSPHLTLHSSNCPLLTLRSTHPISLPSPSPHLMPHSSTFPLLALYGHLSSLLPPL